MSRITKIDELQTFTHAPIFTDCVANVSLRHMMQHLADMLQYLVNSASFQRARGVYDFDREWLEKEVHDLLAWAKEAPKP